MGKTLVTGGSGFLGSHLVRALAERGDDLRLLARRSSKLDHLEDLEFERATGDVTDRRAVRRAVKDVERVFHCAGTTSLRSGDAERVFEINVRGTRVLFEEALKAKVQRATFTSSVAAIGPAKENSTVDETNLYTAGRYRIPYINSKHEAEVEAMRVAMHGLPLVIVNPTFVLGPDDPKGTSMRLVRRFLLRRIPAYVDGGLNIVDVRDVATGHVLADEKGEPGERYILGGRNFTFDRLFADLERISGVPAPAVKMPVGAALAGMELAKRARVRFAVSPQELRSASLWWTFRSTKARRELGFKPRPHEETLNDAVRWQADQLGDRVGTGTSRPERAIYGAVGRAIQVGHRVAGR
jgi:dihydroflavonol-4-reductase